MHLTAGPWRRLPLRTLLLDSIPKSAGRRIESHSRSLATVSHAAQHDETCDLCIVGGGIVGTALACGLAATPTASSLKITLIEAGDLYKPLNAVSGVHSNRVVSLTPTSAEFLRKISAWDRIEPERKAPYQKMKVWDAIGHGHISFDATAIDSPDLAYIVENSHLQAALADRIRSLDGAISVRNRAKVASITGATDSNGATEWPTVHLEDGSIIRARLLVGADGANSKVRTFANIDSQGWDYKQSGLVATLDVEGEVENDTAWQRFLPSGPVALLPLSKGKSSLVWSLPPDMAKRLTSLPPSDFVQILNAAFSSPYQDVEFLFSQISSEGKPQVDFAEEVAWGRGRATEYDPQLTPVPPTVLNVRDGSRACFPLRIRNSERYIKNRIALIGDAAHTIHPLAGQGLNLGLADSESLTNAITHALRTGQDIGNIHALEPYARDRIVPTLAMLGGVDALWHLFGTDNAIVSWVRSSGLNIFDKLSGVKNMIMRFAQGAF
ncbi:putative ubiquinone biosynthesis monooxygenase [Gaertneriomyces sp. JEL0708]|nr:putative ubiquinone biosynthesis monooxygenase [Gaertneriomyces sp. JEL0708]